MIIRILGYLSVDDVEFENWLIANLRPRFQDNNAVQQAIGLCARDPNNIAKYLSSVFASQYIGANELKAASQILRYRTKATEALTSELCENVLDTCLRVFEREMDRGGKTFAFRWSSLIVVYILRRRMFDTGFADPDEHLATRAKNLFSQAMKHSRSGKLHQSEDLSIFRPHCNK